ncbi:MAG: DUF6492 family protein [Pseudonocardiaceae bacterium]
MTSGRHGAGERQVPRREALTTGEGGFDVLICASRSDITGLLPTAIALLLANFSPLAHVHVVTPDVGSAEPVLVAMPEHQVASISIWSDDEVCPEARDLDPWFRQQYIKLHADRVTSKPRIVCLGADTLILDPVSAPDLIDPDGRPRLRFFRYGRPNRHLDFERQRVLNVAQMLSVEPRRSFLLGDFICDLFLFDVEILRALRAHIAVRMTLAELLATLGKRQGWDNRFGEWTAYAVFCLDVIEADIRVTPSTPAFFGQIHSRRDMERTDRYASRIVHFATEPGGTETVLADLVREGRLPGSWVVQGWVVTDAQALAQTRRSAEDTQLSYPQIPTTD